VSACRQHTPYRRCTRAPRSCQPPPGRQTPGAPRVVGKSEGALGAAQCAVASAHTSRAISLHLTTCGTRCFTSSALVGLLDERRASSR